jgi:hypothetical protein
MKKRMGKLQFESGYPTEQRAQKLYDGLDFQLQYYFYIEGICFSRENTSHENSKVVSCQSKNSAGCRILVDFYLVDSRMSRLFYL